MKLSRILATSTLCGIGIAATFTTSAQAASLTSVDLELSLLVDVSGSVDSTEFDLQKQGYVNAFKSASVVNAIQSGAIGKIAVNFIYWSGSSEQQEAVGWTVINDLASATAFADAIDNTLRPFGGSTSISGGLDFAAPKFNTNDFDGTRKVIDVSGDGSNNSGRSIFDARNDALSAVDTINGLTIGDDSLARYYTDNVIGGSDSFVIASDNFTDFESAVLKKLKKEISTPIPEPTTILGTLVFGSLGGGALLRRKRRKIV
jgi:hypothetical protein